MPRSKLRRPSPAMCVALLALFVALGTGAYAAIQIPRNSVGPAQIQKNAVRAPEIAAAAAGPAEIRTGAVQRSELANAAVDESAIQAQAGQRSAIAPDAVTSAALAKDAVRANAIADDAVGIDELAVLPNTRVTRSADQSVLGNVLTPVFFNVEEFDTFGSHDNNANPHWLTAPVTGIYMIEGNVTWEADPDGPRVLVLSKNDSVTLTGQQFGAQPSGGTPMDVSAAALLQKGDYVSLNVLQISDYTSPPTSLGNPLDIVGTGNDKPHLSMTYVSPPN